MTLYDFPGALEDKRPGRMKYCKVSIASGFVAEIDGEFGAGGREALIGFFKAALRFRRHRSSPSRRISCISIVRS